MDAEIALEIAAPPEDALAGAPGTVNDTISVETAIASEVYFANASARGKATLQDKLRGCAVNSLGLVEANWPGLEDSGREMDFDALEWKSKGEKSARKIMGDDPAWRLTVPGYGEALRDAWQAAENAERGAITPREAESAKEMGQMGGPGSKRALDQRVAALEAALVAAKKAVQDLLAEALEKAEPPDDTRYGRTWLVVWDVQSPAAAERLKTDTRTALVVLPASIPMIARGSDLLLVKPADAVREGLDVDDLTMEVLREHGLGPFVTKLVRDPLNITERQRAFWGPAATSRGKVYWGVPLPRAAKRAAKED